VKFVIILEVSSVTKYEALLFEILLLTIFGSGFAIVLLGCFKYISEAFFSVIVFVLATIVLLVMSAPNINALSTSASISPFTIPVIFTLSKLIEFAFINEDVATPVLSTSYLKSFNPNLDIECS